MRKLLLSLLLFTAGLVPLYGVLFARVPDRERELSELEDAVLVWGDSRTAQGIDPRHLAARLDRPVRSFATHGAGVYDFAVFADRAPQRCEAVVALSFAVLRRDIDTDYHRSGLSPWGLGQMVRAGFSPRQVLEVFLRNRAGGTSPVHAASDAYPTADAPVQSAHQYDKFAAERQPIADFARKIEVMRHGLDRLLERGCTVTVIEIPVTETLSTLRDASVYSGYREWLAGYGDSIAVYTPPVPPTDENPFYDLSHLNAAGRRWLTDWLAEQLLDDVRSDDET